MQTLESIIEKLTDEELKDAFLEIVEWRERGVLKVDGVVRKSHKQFIEGVASYPIHAMEAPFLFEIAKRYYQ